jgi:hypothetical protein
MGNKVVLPALAVALVSSCGPNGLQLPFVGDDEPSGPGPWPDVPFKDYSKDYGIDWVQSVGVDAAHNVWVLRERQIGVLRGGSSSVVWTSNVGQASRAFGRESLAMGSTVICGGEAGRAYVGYWTYDSPQPYRNSPEDPEYRKGDLDVVRLKDDGHVVLEAHLGETTDRSGYKHLGIRNSNDWHWDEDRTVLTCQRVMRGRDKGELYIATNHGVTRIRGLTYNSHRHAEWAANGAERIGYNHGLGIGQNGDVLMANEWKVAIITPPERLEDFESHERAPWQVNAWASELNSLEAMDHWRAFQQTKDGRYWVGSEQYGLWRMERTQDGWVAKFERAKELPSSEVLALAGADDGSLFVGTGNAGLWRMKPDGGFVRVHQVNGRRVTQLVYDPSVKPAMLYVVADAQLSVVRGH